MRARRAIARHLPKVGSSAAIVGDQTLVSACNFIATALIARSLGLEAFGWYTMVWLMVLFAVSMQNGFIVSPMMSIGSKQDASEVVRFFSVVFVHEALFCAVAMLGIWAVVSWFAWRGDVPAALPFAAALAGGVYITQDFIRRFLFTRLRPYLVLLIDFVNHAAKLLCLYWLWRHGTLHMEMALLIVAGSGGLSMLLTLPLAVRTRFDLSDFRQVTQRQWRSGRWLAGTGLMQWIAGNSALIMIAGLLGPTAVGGLRAAQSILGVLNIGREAIENFLPQQAGRALALGGRPMLRNVLTMTSIASVAFGSLIVAFLAVFGNDVLRIVYGAEFQTYGFVIAWLSLTFPLALLNLNLICAFRAFERTRPIFICVSLAAGFNLASVYPAVSLFGIWGAIGVTVASDCVILASLAWQMRRLTPH